MIGIMLECVFRVGESSRIMIKLVEWDEQDCNEPGALEIAAAFGSNGPRGCGDD